MNKIRFYSTGGDNSNKRCFGTKPNLFLESGDFSENRDTWNFFPGNTRQSRDIAENNRDIEGSIPNIREDDPNFRDDLSEDPVVLKQRLLELSPPVTLTLR